MNVERNRDSQVAHRADSLTTVASLASGTSSAETRTKAETQMKVSIVVFSPSGNTLRVGRMLEECLAENRAQVQLLNMTRHQTLFRNRDFSRFLDDNVRPHDVLCIGGPVYAHHMHYSVLELIKALPRPGNGWGRFAVPLVTYGTVSSGIALEEAAKLLRKTGRTPVFAMKIDAYHSYSRIFPTDVNVGMPGDEAMPFVEDLSNRITGLAGHEEEQCQDLARELRYLTFADRAKAKVLIREGLFQRHIYPSLRFDAEKCVQCGKCADVCPVLRLEMAETGPYIPKGAPQCIHCGSCIAACPSNAITFKTNMRRWGNIFRKALTGHSPLASNESPKSAVYPLLRR